MMAEDLVPNDDPLLDVGGHAAVGKGFANGGYEGETNIIVNSTGNSKQSAPAVLSFHDICFTAKVKKENKLILDSVSGLFSGGVNAILGPTGSGKSSLLDVLAGRKATKNITGTVLLNGKAVPPDFRLMAGYVVQSLTAKERKRRVDQVIEELQLDKCADSKVGTEFIRGVSGGERKRCNIGMELITAPEILFLDEPTSGLDANTAGHVMRLLHTLSQKGRTVIFSIHQPRYAIYRLFDSLVLLSEGKLAYHGPASQAIQYFHTIGYVIEEHNNPADFFLDLLMGEIERDPSAGPREEPLPILYEQSTVKAQVDSQLQPLWITYEDQGKRDEAETLAYKTSFGRQVRARWRFGECFGQLWEAKDKTRMRLLISYQRALST